MENGSRNSEDEVNRRLQRFVASLIIDPGRMTNGNGADSSESSIGGERSIPIKKRVHPQVTEMASFNRDPGSSSSLTVVEDSGAGPVVQEEPPGFSPVPNSVSASSTSELREAMQRRVLGSEETREKVVTGEKMEEQPHSNRWSAVKAASSLHSLDNANPKSNDGFSGDDADWPALGPPVLDLSVWAAESGENEEDLMPVDNWRKGRSLSSRLHYMWIENTKAYEKYHDVIFEVGSQAKGNYARISAHRIVLLTHCDFFNNFFQRHGQINKLPPIVLPNVSREGLMGMLNYMYKGELNLGDLVQTLGILEAARGVKCHELEKKCQKFLETELSYDNVAAVYSQALEKEDQRLGEIAMTHIKRDPGKVFGSDSFLRLSEENLCSLLMDDSWYMKEVDVFNAVKRWAKGKIRENLNDKENNQEPTNHQLREAMGQAFFAIRFPTMSSTEFYDQISDVHPGLFNSEELVLFSDHFFRSKKLTSETSNFICSSRVKREASPDLSSTTNNSEIGMGNTAQRETEFIKEDEEYDENESIDEDESLVEQSPIDTDHQERGNEDDEDLQGAQPPPKKKRRKSNSSCAASSRNNQSYDGVSGKELALDKFVQKIGNEGSNDDIEMINEVVELTSIPSERIYLPNLKEFNLQLTTKRNIKVGSHFKSFIKSKMSHLKEILFFKKDRNIQNAGGSLFKTLFDGMVNIEIHVEEALIFKLNHEEGTLKMSFLKDAQEIINSTTNIHFKKIAISECELSSLEATNRSQLEILVLRRVKGLKNHREFLRGCKCLKEVCWNDFGGEEIDLTEDLMDKNPHLTKLSLLKAKLAINNVECKNYLTELYLDNCIWDKSLLYTLPKVFPYLKKVQIYGKKCEPVLLTNLLLIESIQWLFIWEFVYTRVYSKATNSTFKRKKKERVLTEESKLMLEFLSDVLGRRYASNETLTFILEKSVSEAGPSNSASVSQQVQNPFDPSKWTGRPLIGNPQKFTTVSELDFKHSSYDEFYKNYDFYAWSETTEAKKVCPRKVSNQSQRVSSSNILNEDSLSLSNEIEEQHKMDLN